MSIQEMLEAHQKWIRGESAKKALFIGMNLQEVDFRGANLRLADFREADTRGANFLLADLRLGNFRGVDFREADFRGVDFRGADVRGADFRGADLRLGNFRGVDFREADLRGVDFRGADVRGADFREADLRGLDLQDVKYDYSTIGVHPAPEGDLIGWGNKNEYIVKLLIPAEAKRSCATTRKMRCEYARVLDILGDPPVDEIAVRAYEHTAVYRVGEIVRCHEWDPDRWNECSGGIHFFLSQEEAKNWE